MMAEPDEILTQQENIMQMRNLYKLKKLKRNNAQRQGNVVLTVPDEPKLEQCLESLIKLQARIKGWLTRKRNQKLI